MAEAKLPAASTRAGLIGTSLGILDADGSHHVRRRAALLQQLCHRIERGGGVPEEKLEAFAQVVVPRFPCSLQPLLAIAIVCSVARSMMGMNCTHFAPNSSRKKR